MGLVFHSFLRKLHYRCDITFELNFPSTNDGTVEHVFDNFSTRKIRTFRWPAFVVPADVEKTQVLCNVTRIFLNEIFTLEFSLLRSIAAEVAIIPRETKVTWRMWDECIYKIAATRAPQAATLLSCNLIKKRNGHFFTNLRFKLAGCNYLTFHILRIHCGYSVWCNCSEYNKSSVNVHHDRLVKIQNSHVVLSVQMIHEKGKYPYSRRPGNKSAAPEWCNSMMKLIPKRVSTTTNFQRQPAPQSLSFFIRRRKFRECYPNRNPSRAH